MKKAFLLLLLSASSSAFAGQADLNILNTFTKAGATTDQFMSQVHLDVAAVFCIKSETYNPKSKKSIISHSCSAMDESSEGGALAIKGRSANAIYALLQNSLKTKTDDGSVGPARVHCSQAIPEVEDGTPAERAACTIEMMGAQSEN